MALSKLELACETVLKTLKISRLTFSVHETPYSVYVTIRKKFAQNLSPVPVDLKCRNTCESFETLERENSAAKLKILEAEERRDELIKKNENLSDMVESLKYNGEQKDEELIAINHEKNKILEENVKLKKTFEKVEQERNNIVNDLESLEKDWKNVNKTLKQKEKIVYDLEKENTKTKEDLLSKIIEFSTFKMRLIERRRQMKKETRKIKRQNF